MEQLLFGERLRNAREVAGMTSEQLADRLGVKTSTLDNWEAGKVGPRANRLQMIASMLNVPLLWLLAGGQKVPDTGIPSQGRLLQKVTGLNAKINDLQSELNELKSMLESGDFRVGEQ